MTKLKPFSRPIIVLGFLAFLAGSVGLVWVPVNANLSFEPYAYYGGCYDCDGRVNDHDSLHATETNPDSSGNEFGAAWLSL